MPLSLLKVEELPEGKRVMSDKTARAVQQQMAAYL